jgi:hypothetical protein
LITYYESNSRLNVKTNEYVISLLIYVSFYTCMWGEQMGGERTQPFTADDHSTAAVQEAFLAMKHCSLALRPNSCFGLHCTLCNQYVINDS